MWKNVSCEYDRWVVETRLCKLRDTSDTRIARTDTYSESVFERVRSPTAAAAAAAAAVIWADL